MTTSCDLPLAAAWDAARAAGRSTLIPFLTAGFPDLPTSAAALQAMPAAGADLIELGIPFSDPLADGPTIQRASHEALRGGMSVTGALTLLREHHPGVPVVLFGYLNPILAYGPERFVHDAGEAGASALLVTDLPAGCDPALEEALAAGKMDLIRLVAPTTPPARLERALRDASGFVYLISRLGVTGAREELASDLADSVARVRAATNLPIAVGFGIATPEQARAVARVADGIVVGSALVRALEEGGVARAVSLVRALRSALDEKGGSART